MLCTYYNRFQQSMLKQVPACKLNHSRTENVNQSLQTNTPFCILSYLRNLYSLQATNGVNRGFVEFGHVKGSLKFDIKPANRCF